MSALTVAQQIAREIGIPPPATLVNNPNQDAVRLLAAINAAGAYLAQQDWNSLLATSTISISASVGYNLPSDYRQIVSLTFWNVSETQPVVGPLGPGKFNANRYGLASFQFYDQYRIEYRGSAQQLVFVSVPGSAEQLVYYYYSKGWVNSSGSRLTTVSADSDTFWIPETAVYADARWRFLKSIGQPYGQEKDEGTEMIRTAMAHDMGGGTIDTGFSGTEFPAAVVPETGFGS